MKNFILIAIIALTTFNTQAQFKKRMFLDGLFLDFKVGTRLGGETSDNVTLGAGFNIQGGVGYMFNKFYGIKGDLGFNTLKSVSVLNVGAASKGSIFRMSLEGVLSISELAQFGVKDFGLNLHAGFGLATIGNKNWKASATASQLSDPFLKGKDDVINIDMPMDVKLLEGNPKIEEVRNQVALKRGPVVYCLETPDLPENTSILDVYLPLETEFTSTYKKELLGGVTTISGALNVRKDKKEGMYRELKSVDWESINAQFVPYFTWSNRGKAEMTVWLPLLWN